MMVHICGDDAGGWEIGTVIKGFVFAPEDIKV